MKKTNKKPTLYIFIGLPFSGKTTYSKMLAEKLHITRISFDETWVNYEKSHGTIPGHDSIEQWIFIKNICEKQCEKLLTTEKNTERL
jgi:adenylate kinase family enzyme